METIKPGDALGDAKHVLHDAEREMAKGLTALRAAETEVADAAAHVERAEHDLEEAEDHKRLVEITVDDQVKLVARGTYPVTVFKAMVGVTPDRELDEVVDGTFVPLDDAGTVVVKKKKVFFSHVRTGASS